MTLRPGLGRPVGRVLAAALDAAGSGLPRIVVNSSFFLVYYCLFFTCLPACHAILAENTSRACSRVRMSKGMGVYCGMYIGSVYARPLTALLDVSTLPHP